MAYIAPDSDIRILQGVPLDNTYRDTIYFANASTQYNYFAGRTAYTLTEYSYVREENKIAVGIKADNLYNCNYLMYRNTAFNNKWFYAFIVRVEYKNNDTSWIYIEPDYFQSWMTETVYDQCYVVREHSATDNIGDNIVPESLELGEYKKGSYTALLSGGWNIIVAATFDKNYADFGGAVYGGIFSGICFNVFDTPAEAKTFIEGAITNYKSDGIVSVFEVPSDLIVAGVVPSLPTSAWEITTDITPSFTSVDGYIPRNKKLFTYPYYFLQVTNFEGQQADYRYEYRNGTKMQLKTTMDISCNPTAVTFPINYNGLLEDYDNKITLGNFPQCAYNTDAYKGWLIQHGLDNALDMYLNGTQNILGGTLSGAMGIAAPELSVALGNSKSGTQLGGAIGGFQQAEAGIASAIKMAYNQMLEMKRANPIHGQGSGAVNMATGHKTLAYNNVYVRAQYARMIDDYFTMFGYATNRLKIPNTHSRPRWNYVECRGATVYGGIPQAAKVTIENVLNRGVTFWKSTADIGNYAPDNSPS